jgi:hypothetical protein
MADAPKNGNGTKTYIAVSTTIISALFAVIIGMQLSVTDKLDTIIQEQSKIKERVSVCETQITDHNRRIDRVESIKLSNQ